MAITRSWSTPITENFTSTQVLRIEQELDFLTSELNKLLANKYFMGLTHLYAGEHKGNFVNWVTKNSHKPYNNWNQYSNKAKYWRLLLVQLYNTHESLGDRLKIAEVIKKYNWDTAQIDLIKNELKNKKISYTFKELENIIASGIPPSFPKRLEAVIDLSQTDSQVFKKVSETSTSLNYSLQLDGREWWNFTVTKPAHLNGNITKFNKPKLQKLKSGKIVIIQSYEIQPMDYTSKTFKTKTGVTGEFGCDLGKLKAFTGAITFNEGSYTTELTMSRETEKLNTKLLVLNKELGFIQKKKEAIGRLLEGKTDSYLLNHWEDLEEQVRLIVSKRTELKKQLGWLTARDIINHCLDYNIKTIKLEDLKFVTGIGGKWDYSSVQDKVSQKAELYFIRTVFVNASLTSQTDPFTGVRVKPKNDRTLTLTDGGEWDRDYTAALEISKRNEVKRGKKPARVLKTDSKAINKSKSRDKLSPTPKRPRRLSNRKRRILFKRQVASYPTSLNGFTGESVFVASSGVGEEFNPTALPTGAS